MPEVSWTDAVEGVRRIVGRDLGIDPASLDFDEGLAGLGASPGQIEDIWRHLDADFGFAEILRSPISEQHLTWLALTVVQTARFDDLLAHARSTFAARYTECEECDERYLVFAAIQTMAERIRSLQYLYSGAMVRALHAYLALYESNLMAGQGLTLRQLYSRIGAKKAETEETLSTFDDLGLLDEGWEDGDIWLTYLCPTSQEELGGVIDRTLDPVATPANGAVSVTLTATTEQITEDGGFVVAPPESCPTFADVGGLDEAKSQLVDTIGILLRFPAQAKELGIIWNGVMLHGPPGTGKTFLARAAAGEFGCSFIQVGSVELIHSLVGESPKAIARAFEVADRHAPCILFFDEIESIAARRDTGGAASYDLQTLSELLKGLDHVRQRPGVHVFAATNSLGLLDPALVRPGRFDLKIRLDLPDKAGRVALLTRQLATRPSGSDIDAGAIADATSGWSASAITSAVNLAALNVLREIGAGADGRQLQQADILAAIKATGSRDRPMVDDFRWEDLILSEPVLAELKQVQRLVESPDRAKAMGIDLPRGVLLYGPPGTGKTTIARVLAAQAKTSFYPMKGSDLVSMWLGASSRNIADLFARARENAPSIIFIDELDAIAGTRGGGPGSAADRERDATVNQLLQEVDGLQSGRSVFVLGATNRPELVDPALLRGGRLGRQIEIPLPNQPQRLAMLERFAGPLLLGPDVSLRDISHGTDGYSGADINALCQQAAIAALVRTDGEERPTVSARDFDEAFSRGRERLSVSDFTR